MPDWALMQITDLKEKRSVMQMRTSSMSAIMKFAKHSAIIDRRKPCLVTANMMDMGTVLVYVGSSVIC